MLGSVAPGVEPHFETLLWPMMAALLYTTFVQAPLLHVRDAFRDRRFVLAILLGNFVSIPSRGTLSNTRGTYHGLAG